MEINGQFDEGGVALDPVFAQKTLVFAQKSIAEIEQLEIFFNQLQQNPAIKATLKSEVSRLNDLKNCDYHRTKTTQILNDYHMCVEENLRLKEMNMKLVQTKKSSDAKLEMLARKLQQQIELNQKNTMSKATFGDGGFTGNKSVNQSAIMKAV